jgi:hypothetical protein
MSATYDAHRPADDAGARLDVLHVATETITLTRTFGMKPASREGNIAPAVLGRVVVKWFYAAITVESILVHHLTPRDLATGEPR